MTREEESLLMFLETCMVDKSCKIDARYMNEDDMRIAEGWNKIGFLRFGRLKMKDIETGHNYHNTHFVIIPEEAFKQASQLRYERACRGEKRLKESVAGGYNF